MTVISIDQHQMTHWLPPEAQYGRFTVPADMVSRALASLPCRCGDDWGPGCRCHVLRGVRVNDIDVMPPWGHFRKRVIDAAREFVKRKAQESLQFIATTPEADMLVYGPYHHKPVVDFSALATFGRQGDENHHPDKLDFKIWCEFTQKYARATDLGPGRPRWALDFWAEVDREMEQEQRARQMASQSGLILATR